MSRPTWKLPSRPILCASACLGGILTALATASAHPVDLAPSSPSRITPTLRADFDAYLEAALGRYDVPGAVVAVVENRTTAYAKVLGKRAHHDDAVVDSKTLFMIGSVTKSMTSMMMASQVERGKLDWNTEVREISMASALWSTTVARPVLPRCSCYCRISISASWS